MLLILSALVYCVGMRGDESHSSDLEPTLAQMNEALRALAGVTSIMARDLQLLEQSMKERQGREVERDSNQQKDMTELTLAIQRLTTVIEKKDEQERWRR